MISPTFFLCLFSHFTCSLSPKRASTHEPSPSPEPFSNLNQRWFHASPALVSRRPSWLEWKKHQDQTTLSSWLWSHESIFMGFFNQLMASLIVLTSGLPSQSPWHTQRTPDQDLATHKVENTVVPDDATRGNPGEIWRLCFSVEAQESLWCALEMSWLVSPGRLQTRSIFCISSSILLQASVYE